MSAELVPALEVSGVSKVFQGQRALDDLQLTINPGEVHAVLGHNGSGKSTLIKILAGYHQPEAGATASAYGKPLTLGSAAAAREAGLRFIHQELGLIPTESITDNLALGGSYRDRWWLSNRREGRAATALLREHGIGDAPEALVSSLSPARQAMVAIARALRDSSGEKVILVLDEPTAALPAHEVEHLFEMLRTLKERGGTIVYVTHRLSEVLTLADRVSVLRDGCKVATTEAEGLTEDELVRMIVGRDVEAYYPAPPPAQREIALEVTGLGGGSVREASLRLHRGEILGVTGLIGSGHEDFLKLVFGAEERAVGSVAIGDLQPDSPRSSIAAGMMFAAADRRHLSGIPSWTVRENLTLPQIPSARRFPWISERAEQGETRTWLDQLGVLPPEPEKQFASLSGGNQQKLVLARLLRCGASVLLLEEPTSGVDVGARHSIYEALGAAVRDGAAVLMSSTDAEELAAVCDRVAVFRDGRIAHLLEHDALTVDHLTTSTVRAEAAAATPTQRS